MYLVRLDDASIFMNNENWDKIESIFDRYNILPIVGIIPNNQDESITTLYSKNINFWIKAKKWQDKGWTIALHGYNHKYSTVSGGINPVHNRSEFAGLSYDNQSFKIKNGFELLLNNGLIPKIFFAPSHTYDLNTLKAIKDNTNINVICDTFTSNFYYKHGFYFIPLNYGKMRHSLFKLTTFCIHPNTMNESDYIILEKFIIENKDKFISFNDINLYKKKISLLDLLLKKFYLIYRIIRKKVK